MTETTVYQTTPNFVLPDLVEIQRASFRWFLEEGLPELFQTFSPIWDFTQTNYIELVSFSLGEPKYSLQECRDRADGEHG